MSHAAPTGGHGLGVPTAGWGMTVAVAAAAAALAAGITAIVTNDGTTLVPTSDTGAVEAPAANDLPALTEGQTHDSWLGPLLEQQRTGADTPVSGGPQP